MQIVTLTTDFGWRDAYVATLKGILLQHTPTLNLIDVTHLVQPHNIAQGAFVLKNTWKNFPKGTIHIISVNNFSSRNLKFIAASYQDHYFIGPDNGIFSLLFETLPTQFFELTMHANNPFSQEKMFGETIQKLTEGKSLTELGTPILEIKQRITLHPVISTKQIRGSVIYIDHYENVVVNIHRELFESVQNERAFALYFKRNDPITKLSKYYYDVPVGETLCFFNSTNHLEIAINMGKASSMLGLNVDDTIQVDFTNLEF